MEFDAYIGRGNARRIQILEGGAVVDPNVVTRVVLSINGQCLDTSDATHPIALVEDETEIELRLGLWDQAVPGTVEAYMTVFTTTGPPEGLAWPEGDTIEITFIDWGACP